jgi:hypothetical protein
MQRKLLLLLAVSSLGGILTAPLGAQSLSSPLQANIPFEFAVGGRTMPAGEYTIVRSSVRGLVQLVRSGGSHESGYVNMVDEKISALGDQPMLAFRRYGSQYFLARVSSGAGTPILRLPASRAEREATKTASRPVQTVTLAAVLVRR